MAQRVYAAVAAPSRYNGLVPDGRRGGARAASTIEANGSCAHVVLEVEPDATVQRLAEVLDALDRAGDITTDFADPPARAAVGR